MQEFSPSQIKEVFSLSNKTSHVAILYFALYFNEQSSKVRLEEKSKGVNLPERGKTNTSISLILKGYSRDLLDSLPIKELLSYVEHKKTEYSELYPKMLTLAQSQFPQLFHVVNLLTEEEQRTR